MKINTAAIILATLPAFLDSSTTTVQAGLLPRLKPKGHLAFTKRAGEPEWTSKQDSTLLAPDPPPERIAQAREQNDQMAKQAYPNSMAVSGGSAASSDSKDHPSERLKRSASSSSSSGPPSSWQHTHDEAESSLMRVNGGSASVSNKDSPYDKRAAMPQGKFKSTKTKPVHLKAAAVMPRNEFHVHDNKDDGGGRMGETMLGAQRGYKRATTDGVEHSKESRNLGGFEYGKEPVRGVNIGGWLVLEPWITPSIFTDTGDDAVVDEYTYGAKYGAQEAASRLKKHWDTWVTEEDFSLIASYGLNHVRIPIGYWALDTSKGEPYPQGQYPYLFKAVEWSAKYGLKVIIDIHGAPGSQNGFDNSGRRGSVNWHNEEENVNRTRKVLQIMIDDFASVKYVDTVTAIELLNEPAGFVGQKMVDTVKQYYYDGYGQVRYTSKAENVKSASDTVVVIHDAFQPLSTWKGFMPSPSWRRVMLDTHYYSIFNENDLRMSDDDRIKAVCRSKAGLVESNKDIWTMVGEWTPANTDCAAKLNGAGVGSRYDGTYPGSTAIGSCKGKTGSADTFSDEFKTFLGKYWEVQADVFESASGWVQWAWKTESADEWSYKKGVEFGWIPKDPSTRVHGNQCGDA